MDKMTPVITQCIEQLPGLVNGNPQLIWRGRFLNTTFLIKIDSAPYYVTIKQGRIEEVQSGPALLRSWSFAVKASTQAWLKHWETFPEPGWHDIFSMAKTGQASIEGDLHPLMANLRYVKEVLAAPRAMIGG